MKYITVYHTNSNIHGIGVFTSEDLKKGDIIGVAHAYYGGHWYMTTHGYYNHSYNSNCIIELNKPNQLQIYNVNKQNEWHMLTLLVANRDIKAKEELTVDYTKQSYLEQPGQDWK